MALSRRREQRAHVWPLMFAGVAGAGLAYLFDPDRGRRRRSLARERSAAMIRHNGEHLRRLGRRIGAGAYGLSQKLIHLRSGHKAPPDDVTLTHRVESEIFRDPAMPKGRINVNAEHGVIVLRGELDRPEQIAALEAAARKVAGVRGVENLLHPKGTPAPNKIDARRASPAAP